jgi:hypothetical protein
VRIANEHGVQVLRGMRVKPEFQRQGTGMFRNSVCPLRELLRENWVPQH